MKNSHLYSTFNNNSQNIFSKHLVPVKVNFFFLPNAYEFGLVFSIYSVLNLACLFTIGWVKVSLF